MGRYGPDPLEHPQSDVGLLYGHLRLPVEPHRAAALPRESEVASHFFSAFFAGSATSMSMRKNRVSSSSCGVSSLKHENGKRSLISGSGISLRSHSLISSTSF